MPDNNPSKPARHYKPSAPTPDQGKPPQSPTDPDSPLSNRPRGPGDPKKPGTDREVRTFGTTTRELLELSDWLASEGCRHVALEATGVYWKPVWHILSDGDFELVLANARHVKNVPGRKSDVSDAAWQADLLAHGLIRASFVPDGATQELRG